MKKGKMLSIKITVEDHAMIKEMKEVFDISVPSIVRSFIQRTYKSLKKKGNSQDKT